MKPALVLVVALLSSCAPNRRACYAANEGAALAAVQKEGHSTAWPVWYGELRRRCGR